MKISLLTYFYSSNNGVVMQAYATCRFLKEQGYDVEIIDLYHPGALEGKSYLFRKINSVIQFWRMKNFKKKFYPPFTKRYLSLKELQINPPKSDCYVVGSDQVWNPNISKDSLLAYFLDFGHESVKKISYASSFGIKIWTITDQRVNNRIKDLLASFIAVSVREEAGRNLCKDNFGIDAQVVLDPTMLHNNYYEITGEIIPKREVVCYKLNKNKDFFDNINVVSKELNIPLRLLNNRFPIRGFKYNLPPSTKQWIKKIAGAEFVVTDSFHGAAFSLIYQKQFVVILNNDGKNARLENLMMKVGLENRLFKSVNELKNDYSWKQKIDYNIVSLRINTLRQESINYFCKSLNSIKQ